MDIIGFKRNKSHRGLLITGIVDMVIFFLGFIFPFFYWGDELEAQLFVVLVLSIGFVTFIFFYAISFFRIKKQASENSNEDTHFPEIRFTPFPWVYLIFISTTFIGGLIFCGVNYFKNHELMKSFGFLLLLGFFSLIPTWVYALRKNSRAILWNMLLYLPTLVWGVCVFAFCLFACGILWIFGYPTPIIIFWDKANLQFGYQYALYPILFFYYLTILNLYCLRSKRVQNYFKIRQNSSS